MTAIATHILEEREKDRLSVVDQLMCVVEVVDVLLSCRKLYKFSLIPRPGNGLVHVLLRLQAPSCQTSTQL